MEDKVLPLAAPAEAGTPAGETDLTVIAEGIIDRLQTSSPGRLTEIVVMKGLMTRADGASALTVLEDIIGNAWAHTARRASTLLVIGAKTNGGPTVFFVRDNGEGFDGDRAGHFFMCLDKFAIAPRSEGADRPLAAARQIIDGLGGRLWAEPAAGLGVVIYFTLEGEARRVA